MVMDFGIALAVSAAAGGRMTETGLSLGTPHYMSPEQATADKQITARSDVYSLASVLYEMLTGNPPHMGSSAQQIIMKIIAEPVVAVTSLRKNVPPNVAAALARALEKLPADRFESAKTFADALANPHFTFDGAPARANTPATRAPRAGIVRIAMAALVIVLAIAGGWWIGRRSSETHQLVAQVAVNLDPGEDLSGPEGPHACCNQGRPSLTALALSPDGQTLVFAGNRDDTPWLFRRPIGEDHATPIAGTEGAVQPVFSPDGRHLLFWASGWLRAVPLEGGTPVEVVPVGTPLGASWGDDDRIVFRDLAVPNLRRVSPSGGRIETLPTAPDARLPHVLPGSEVVLYTTTPGSNALRNVEALRLKTGVRDTVLSNAADARYAPGGYLVFARTGTLMGVPFDASSARVTGAPFGILADVMQAIGGLAQRNRTDAAQFAISSGGHLAYLAGGLTPEAKWDVTWVSRTGRASKMDVPPGYHFAVRISPDGRRVALSGPSQVHPGIWIADVNGPANLRQISSQMVPWVVWSPGGDRLAYDADNALWTIDVRGGTAPEQLLSHDLQPALWTRQDEILGLAEDSTGQMVLRAVSVETREERTVLAEVGGSIWYPALSRDGRWLAYTFVKRPMPEAELAVRSWPSLDDRRVIATGMVNGAAWGSGGELFYGEGFADERMMSVRINETPGGEPTTPRELFKANVGGATPIRSWDVRADGERFLTLRIHLDSAGVYGDPPAPEIHLVLNWLRELEASR
jgi:hypothetical protein